MNKPLMSRAVAAWLIENTSLSFKQIADFCSLPLPEIQSIADGEVLLYIQPKSPVASGELTLEEIERCQKDPSASLQLQVPNYDHLIKKKMIGRRYTPLNKRQSKPDAIAWILKYHPQISDNQIIRLIGTTRHTIDSIRHRTHKSIQHLKPADPVTLGLCTQTALNQAIEQAKGSENKSAPQPYSAEPLSSTHGHNEANNEDEFRL